MVTAWVSTVPIDAVCPWIVLYIGPDVFLPITSALAAIGGVLLMFWHRIAAFVRTTWRKMSGRTPDQSQ